MMISDSLRHGLDLVPAGTGIERHEDEEREVAGHAQTRQRGVGFFGLLQTEKHQRAEAHREYAEEKLADPPAVAERLDRRAIEPRYEEERHDRQQHQQRTDLLVRNGAQD